MRRISLRWLIALSLVSVTFISFFISTIVLFSALSRILWMEHARKLENRLRYVMGDMPALSGNGSIWSFEIHEMERPINVSDDYEEKIRDIVVDLSDEKGYSIIYDANGDIIAKCSSRFDEFYPNYEVFRSFRRLFIDYKKHKNLDKDLFFDKYERISLFWNNLLFAPMGIVDTVKSFFTSNRHSNFILFFYDFIKKNESKNSRKLNVSFNLYDQSEERSRVLIVYDKPQPLQKYVEDIDGKREANFIHNREKLCPPHFMRVFYEAPDDIMVFIAPLVRGDQIVGYAQISSPWKWSKYMLGKFATQTVIICFILSVLVVGMGMILVDIFLLPLKKITKAFHKVSGGDLSVRTDMEAGCNELYEIGYNFDQMVESLERNFYEQRRFIGDASHELKTPITSLLGVAEVFSIIRKDMGDNPQIDKYLATMKRELERMSSLVHDLLLLSRSSEPGLKLNLDPICIKELIDEACQASLRDVMNREVKIIPNDELWTLGDQRLLTQALRNVIDNALHYTPKDKMICVSYRKEGDEICIEVDDEGCGIKAEHIKNLGKRFYRIDSGRARASGGSGLGLSIVKTLVECHKGRLVITSQEGVGTQVKIYLPLPQT